MKKHRGIYTAKTRPEDMEKDFPQEHKPLTNGDRIRSMTDEELAEWLVEHVDCGEGCPVFPHICESHSEGCEDDLLNWLKQEVNDGTKAVPVLRASSDAG